MSGKTNKKSHKKLVITLIVVAIVVTAVAVGASLAWKKVSRDFLPYYFDERGIRQPDKVLTFTVEKQHFERDIANMLKQGGIVVSEQRFLDYINEHHPDFVAYNGVYTVSADMSFEELVQKLKNPDMRIEYVKVTVPEGKNVRGIAAIMEQNGICTADEFIAAADSYEYDSPIIAHLALRDNTNIGYKLEGFLFPATYEFRKDTVTAQVVVKEMLDTFSEYVTDDIITAAANKGLSVNQLVSFASVIQAEAFTKESMANISSVFWNRYNSSYKRFESDPTTTYAKSLEGLPHYTKAMREAYDTYVCVGPPVGPINCPGMDTINAVINPTQTNYFYFITDSENNFYFNETYKEHVADCYATGLWKR